MDDDVPRLAEPTAETPAPPALPSRPEAVTSDADALRQLIDAGASSPEDLRALAARIREHRALEESVWRSEVRPGLLKSKKRRFTLNDLRDRPERSNLGLGLGLLGGVLVLLLVATQSSPLWIVLPVVVVLVYAYRQGTRAGEAIEGEAVPDAEAASEDPPS